MSSLLPSRRLLSWVSAALSLSLAVPVVAATGAAAADVPSPPVVTAKLTDLGSVGGDHLQSWPFDITNNGEVMGRVRDSDPLAVDPSYPYKDYPVLWAGGQARDLTSRIGADGTPRWANDAGTVAGSRTNDHYWVAPAGGNANEFGQPIKELTEDGVLVVDDGLQWVGGEHRVLKPASGRETGFVAADDSGQVVGAVNMAADPGTSHSYQTFRTRPGEPLDEAQDLLKWGEGNQSLPADINASGLVVGKGLDNRNSYVPVWWDPAGDSHVAPARFTAGYLTAVNDGNMAVGVMADGDGKERAAVWDLGSGGAGTFLQELLPADSGYVLDEATGINEQNQVIGTMHRVDHPTETRAFLLDLSYTETVSISSFDIEHHDFPSGDWIPVPSTGTYDGNIVRLHAQVKNPTPYPAFVTVQFTDADGNPLRGGSVNDVIPAGSSVEESLERDTAGQAWNKDGSPAVDAYRYGVKVTVGTQVKDSKTASVHVLPRPVVLVHGYKSNAESSWGTFKSDIIASGHPYLRGYAVGDGQFDGLMHTGDIAAPFAGTNTIQENATEEGVYIADLRKKLDAWHVDIVAHSMGGLISRYYIQQLMPDPVEYDGRAVVNRLIQLGTPNQGSPCADLLLQQFDEGTGDAHLVSQAPFMPATLQLSQPYLTGTFNKLVTALDGVRISNEVGVHIPIPCGELELGDVVVPSSSARWVLRDLVETSTWHLGMTDNLEDYTRYVLPRLKDAPVPAASVVDNEVNYGLETDLPSMAAVPGEPPASPADPNAPATATSFGSTTVDVPAGADASADFSVPAGDAFGVVATMPSTIGLALVDPSGTVRASFAPGSEGARAPFPALRVDSHAAGTWRVRVTNSSNDAVTVPVVAWVAGGSIGLGGSAYPLESGSVLVQAQVLASGSPAAATVTATVVGSDGQAGTVSLVDDGEHSDGSAGDGLYGGTSAALPDGDVAVAIHASGEGWQRSVSAATTAKTIDRSDKTLTLSSQPGGSVTAAPSGPTYRYGTSVTLTPTPQTGELALGWTVDGEDRPAGPLTVTMDRNHTVVAKFGHYTLTELPALHGGSPGEVAVTAINNAGQVTATSSYGGYQSRDHHVGYVWQAGHVTELAPVCDSSPTTGTGCDTSASDINDAGLVLGSAGDAPAVWREGVPTMLPHAGPADAGNFAGYLSPTGQVLGGYRGSMPSRPQYGTWNAGSTVGAFTALKAQATAYGFSSGPVNRLGDMALDRTEFNFLGQAIDWWPSRYSKGVLTALPRPADYCVNDDWTSGHAMAINASGQIAGYLTCAQQRAPEVAVVWNGSTPTVLGVGQAYGITTGGMVYGVSHVGSNWTVPTLWVDGETRHLDDYIPGACPPDRSSQTAPCFLVTSLLDMNDRGDLVVRGGWVDPGQEYYPGLGRSYVLSYSRADADLGVTQTAPLAEVGPGTTTTRTVTVTNHGPSTATQVVIDLALPAALSVTSCTSSGGECTSTANRRTVTVAELASGASATMTVTATVPASAPTGATYVTTATAVSRAVRDPKPADNHAETTVTVKPFLDDGVSFSDPVPVGSSSSPVTRHLTNRSEQPLTVTTVSASEGFAVGQACVGSLAPGASCDLPVTFRPSEVRAYTGALTAATSGGAFSVPLLGTGALVNAAPVLAHLTEPQLGVVGRDFTLVVPFTDTDAADTHTARANCGSGEPTTTGVTVAEHDGSGDVRITCHFDKPIVGVAVVLLVDSAGHSALTGVPFRVTDVPANAAPVVMAVPSTSVEQGVELVQDVSFTDSDSAAWTATVEWGDGSTSTPVTLAGTTVRLRHTYDKPGLYTATVTVTDAGGLSGATHFSTTVTARNTIPAVSLSAAPAATEGVAWTMTGSFADPDEGDSWTALADYGDGTVLPVKLDGSTFVLSHTWADGGTGGTARTVTVTVTDSRHAHGESGVGVVVANAVPVAHVVSPSASLTVRVGEPVVLAADFTDAGTMDGHDAQWNVAPSEGSAVALPASVTETGGSGSVTGTFTATTAGSYRVAVSVSDRDGGTGTATAGTAAQPVLVTVVDPSWHVAAHGAVAAPGGSCLLSSTCGSSGGTAFELAASYGQGLQVLGTLRLTTSGFKLASDRLSSLVVAGDHAVVNGEGVVNGTVPVTWTATAVKAADGRPAALRVQVWSTGEKPKLVWDNAPHGVGDTSVEGKVSGGLDLG